MLVDGRGSRVGGFALADAALEAVPPARLLKPAQMIDVAGSKVSCLPRMHQPETYGVRVRSGPRRGLWWHIWPHTLTSGSQSSTTGRNSPIRKTSREADEITVTEALDDYFGKAELDDDSYVVIVTRGHAHDKAALGNALRTKAGYVGMIGSRRKINLIYQALLTEGFTPEDLERVHAPIGLPIGGETPQEIGMSIVAEMIQVRTRKDQIHRRDV